MRHEHVARGGVDGHVRDGLGHGIGVALNVRVRKPAAHVRGLHKRQQPDVHRSERIMQRDRRERTVIHGRDVDDAPAEGEPLRRVVVAADEQHGHAACAQLGEKAVEQLDRLDRRHGLVVHVARDEHAVRLLVVQNGEDLPQDVRLILKHGKFIHTLAEVQV